MGLSIARLRSGFFSESTPKTKKTCFLFGILPQKFYPGLNLAIYGNPQADKLMEEIRQTNDLSERQLEIKKPANHY